jgi:hypothetical protein
VAPYIVGDGSVHRRGVVGLDDALDESAVLLGGAWFCLLAFVDDMVDG